MREKILFLQIIVSIQAVARLVQNSHYSGKTDMQTVEIIGEQKTGAHL